MSERPPLDPTVDAVPSRDEQPAAADPSQDATGSLPPIPAEASVLQALGALPPLEGETLNRGDAAAAAAGEQRARPAHGPLPARYEVHGEIARGGMGAVLHARDTELGREIAAKVLLETLAGRTQLEQRFVEEARIAGQLQHPGIVPVYDLGRSSADHRPWFTMKLVKGQTLAALLSQRKDLADDRPHFLAIFETVCQALAYAHSRGVIHRDLKPANIMVGRFGEVQVMDWGLAKLLTSQGTEAKTVQQQQPEPVSIIQLSRPPGAAADTGTHTLAGSVLGTPAFMAPEQARGEVERIDERCDVFGLGAMLCVILTGRPPYTASSLEETHRQAQLAELTEAFRHLQECGADAELVALARACLSPDPADRPRHAGVVADAMADYRAGVEQRLRTAERERAAAEVRIAGERKARRLTALLAVLMLVLAASAAVGWRWWEAQQATQRDRLVQVARLVEADLAEAEKLRARADAGRDAALWAAALAAARRAEGRLSGESGFDDLREQVEQTIAGLQQEQTDRKMVATLERVRLRKIELKDDELDLAIAAGEYAAAFRHYGIDVTVLGVEEAVARLQASGIRAELAVALDDWAEHPGKAADGQRLREIALRGDPSPWRRRMRFALARGDVAAMQELAGEAEALAQPPTSLFWLATGLVVSGDTPAGVDLLRRALRQHPVDFWINFQLAAWIGETGAASAAEATRYFAVARALRPGAAAVHYNLGVTLINSGSIEEGIASYREAIRLKKDYAAACYNLGRAEAALARRPKNAIPWFREAIRLKPAFVEARIGLGNALHAIGDREGAKQAYREAIKQKPDHARGYTNLGSILFEEGKTEEAIKLHRTALRYNDKMASAHSNLAAALWRLDQLDEAIVHARKAIALRPTFTLAHSNLGRMLLRQGKVSEGLASLRRAVRLDPTDVNGWFNLGNALLLTGRFDAAVTAFEEAIRRERTNPRLHERLGAALQAEGNLKPAIASYQEAIRLAPGEAEFYIALGKAQAASGQLDPAIAAYREGLKRNRKHGDGLMHLGLALQKKGLRDQALAMFQEAVRADSGYALAHSHLGEALLAAGQPEKAIAEFREALRLQKDFVEAHKALGHALERIGRWEEAVTAFQECTRLRPKDRDGWAALAWCLDLTGQVSGAIAAYRKVVAFEPTNAAGWCLLGSLLQRQGQLRQAVISLRRGHAWAEGSPGFRYPSGVWLAQAERLAALEPKLDEILAGKVKPGDAAERLDFALLCQCKAHDGAAARFYLEAFTERPGLAEEGVPSRRFLAARAAARAGCGQGKDADKVDAKERQRWRQQALEWLRADAAGYAKKLQTGDAQAAREALLRWQGDPDLAGVREKTALAKLPAAAEREGWQKLWAEVQALLQKLTKTGRPSRD
jgi:serine/threonine-protein kinase